MTPTFVVYYFCDLGLTSARIETELQLLLASCQSVRRAAPSYKRILITNQRFWNFVKEYSIFSDYIIDDTVNLANLDLKRVENQLSITEKIHHSHGAESRLIFLDHDTLMSTSPCIFFSLRFDFLATCNFSVPYVFSENFFPINTGVASINAGVQLSTCSKEAISFMEAKLRMCHWIDANKAEIPLHLSDEPFAWGCDQLSMMSLMNEHIFIKKQRSFMVESAKIEVVSTKILNYSPEVGSKVSSSEFYDHMIWHFKGRRRSSMVQFWNMVEEDLLKAVPI